MNLAEIDRSMSQKILSREEHIGFFVFKGSYYWVVDWDEHFNLNYQKNIDAIGNDKGLMQYLPKGKSVEAYKAEVASRYRGGIVTLTESLFPTYRDGDLAKVVTTDMLRDEFFIEDNGQYADLSRAVETELSFNIPMSEDLVQLRMRLFSKLPKFYINYDRKIFMHMVRGRFYDKVVLDGWWGAECDFEHMIPTSHRYWTREPSEDFWAITNFSNG